MFTSGSNFSEHTEVVRTEVAAKTDDPASVNEDIGHTVTGGIVFTWNSRGTDLIYALPVNQENALFEYSVANHRSTRLGSIDANVLRIVSKTNEDLRYRISNQPTVSKAAPMADPAYRYSHATFSSTSKTPWRSPQITAPDETVHCYAWDRATGSAQLVATDTVDEYDPTKCARSYAPDGLDDKNYHQLTYEGGAVNMAAVSPNGKRVLFGANVIEKPETAPGGRQLLNKAFFVQDKDGTDSSRIPLFVTASFREGGITSIFWGHDSNSVFYFARLSILPNYCGLTCHSAA